MKRIQGCGSEGSFRIRARSSKFLRQRHQYDAKLRADGICFREDPHHLLGRGVGRNVPVGWLAPEEQVAHATAYEVGLMAVVAQGTHNRDCEIAGTHISEMIQARELGKLRSREKSMRLCRALLLGGCEHNPENLSVLENRWDRGQRECRGR